MKECTKSVVRRMADSNFLRRFFVGEGVDIGGRPDPLALYASFFPFVSSVRTWDLDDGDAQFMRGVQDGAFDFVHASHCLEHLNDPSEGLRNWMRVTKPGGFVVVTVPDEDLYEQGEFPSTFNRDHKWTFTILKARSWSDRSINVLDLLRSLGPEADVERVQLLNATYRYDLPRYDQTLTPVAESGIEFVVRRRPAEEAQAGGLVREPLQPSPELRRHLNQYRNDLQTLKRANTVSAPFTDETEL